MKLWHTDLLKDLPGHQLLGQWREVHAIIGIINKHGKVNHSTINYVNDHPTEYLYAYALIVWDEMLNRGYNPDLRKLYVKFTKHFSNCGASMIAMAHNYQHNGIPIYPEHNAAYMAECKENLKRKGVII